MVLEQIRNFLIFLVLGIIISILFEIFRVIRKNIKTNDLIISIEDIVYLLISGFLFIKSILVFANGNIRFYIFVAFFLGIIIYILTIKSFCDIILTVIIKSILFLIKQILLLIKWIHNILLKFFSYVRNLIYRGKINEENH